MGFLNRLFGAAGGQTPRQQVARGGLSCRGWLDHVEPYKVPGAVPVELTVEPLSEGIRISFGNAYSAPLNPSDMIRGAFQIGASHSFSGPASKEPFLLPYSAISALAGQVMSVEKQGDVTRRETIETIDACRTKPLPKGKTFQLAITYRSPKPDESMVTLTLVADRERSVEDPELTLALFNSIANAIAGHATTPPERGIAANQEWRWGYSQKMDR